MSVRVRLNDRSFFQSPMVIGSRLYEAGEVATDASQSVDASAQTQNASVNQQPSIPDQVNNIIRNAFQAMGNSIDASLKAIQLPQGMQWVQPQKPADQTPGSMVQAVQQFISANIDVAKKTVAQPAAGGQ